MTEQERGAYYARLLSLRYPHLADEIAAAGAHADRFDALMIELGQVFRKISQEGAGRGDDA